MKTFLLLLTFFLGFAQISPAQRKKSPEIPAKLQSFFIERFPEAVDAKWEVVGNQYEVEFKDHGLERALVFDSSGNWLYTETEIRYLDLPSQVQLAFRRDQPNLVVKEVTRMERADGSTQYEIEAKKGRSEAEYRYTSMGVFCPQ